MPGAGAYRDKADLYSRSVTSRDSLGQEVSSLVFVASYAVRFEYLGGSESIIADTHAVRERARISFRWRPVASDLRLNRFAFKVRDTYWYVESTMESADRRELICECGSSVKD